MTQYNLRLWLEQTSCRVASGLPWAGPDFQPMIRPADPQFGDFQANGVLPLAKSLKKNPRELGEALASALRADPDIASAGVEISIAGPGFINFRLPADSLLAWLERFPQPEPAQAESGEVTVVDFSSPNTAKEMHVGHIRSTVIGESLARLLAFATGKRVIRDNHIGDWGTQFGILILAFKRFGFSMPGDHAEAITRLEDLYRQGNQLVESDPAAREEARAELVKLQNGDPENLAHWQQINAASAAAFDLVYQQLGIRFDLTLGESFYRDKVDQVCRELKDCGVAEESEGALVVFHPEHPRFASQPFIIRKSDGASNYATTDLATVLYRVEELQAREIVYVTDGRQRDHFEQLFLTVEKWFAATGRPQPVLRHVWFGTILGSDNKAIKTRSGGSIKLRELLAEAVERAEAIVTEKSPGTPADERRNIAATVGVAAVRYADLMQNRTGDYVFAWDKLLSFEGNTAPYLLYAVARIHGIFRRLELAVGEGTAGATPPETPEETGLARQLIHFPAALELAIADLRPHFLCNYLFELTEVFGTFYNANKVQVDDPAVRARRLLLCHRTLSTLATGLRLLGIEPLERM